MKILITGAGGFLGKYIATTLTEHEIYAFDRSQLDLCSTQSVKQCLTNQWYDAVIHCAANGRNSATAQDWNIIGNNLAAVMNLMIHRQCFGQLINVGTGAEFDISQDIDQVDELEIFNRNPIHSYGLSKNIIARYLYNQVNCVTLRLFGCFDSSEDQRRLLKKFHQSVSLGHRFDIQDKPFDMFSAEDFVTVIRAVLNKQIVDKDINCVYAKKHRLSDILNVYCNIHGLDRSLINVTGHATSYTGNGKLLDRYNLNLLGLEQSLTKYEY